MDMGKNNKITIRIETTIRKCNNYIIMYQGPILKEKKHNFRVIRKDLCILISVPLKNNLAEGIRYSSQALIDLKIIQTLTKTPSIVSESIFPNKTLKRHNLGYNISNHSLNKLDFHLKPQSKTLKPKPILPCTKAH